MTSNWSQELYLKAYRFAAVAHRSQLYPGTDLPYLMHLSFVSMEVLGVLSVESGYDGDLAVQCALLHDTIEDTEATYEQLLSIHTALADTSPYLSLRLAEKIENYAVFE